MNENAITAQMMQLRKKMEGVLPHFKVYAEASTTELAALEDNKEDKKDERVLKEEKEEIKEDEERLMDFILVYSTSEQTAEGQDLMYGLKMARIDTFLENLRSIGFDIERDVSAWDPTLIFVKIYGCNSMLKRFAGIYDINLMCNNVHYSTDRRKHFKRFACKVNSTRPGDPLFRRAPESFSDRRPKDITIAERIMVVHQILRVIHYGRLPYEQGIGSLLEKKIFIDAYPLHDADLFWTEEGALSDRQLLYRFWASPKEFWKKQPLNLVHKYFGPEVAFYYGFLAYYTFLLVPAAGLGILCFIYSVVTLCTPFNERSREICNSRHMICPACEQFESCRYEELKESCVNANISYLLDNRVTLLFAVLISLWATLFVELWKRQQTQLAFRWNVLSVSVDTSTRPEFEITAKFRKVSDTTGLWEPYEAPRARFCHYFISYSCVLFLILVAVGIVIAIMVYHNSILLMMRLSNNKFTRKYATIIASMTSSTISAICIVSFQQVYIKISQKLTKLENPRTRKEYNDSYTYKIYVFSFINGYSVAFYVAFFKGRFYTYPGDVNHQDKTYISKDVCGPTGCAVNLFIHLIIVMLVKSMFLNILQIVNPLVYGWIRRADRRKKQSGSYNVWEEQYSLKPADRFFLVDEYQEIALQYGFVTFFAAAFPLAPLMALVHAIMSIRVDAFKMVRTYRRPVPLLVSGLQAWEGIFKITTKISIIALIIAFTLDFIPRQIFTFHSLEGEEFFNRTFSEFATKDYPNRGNVSHPDKCYYRGLRYGPEHEKKYELTRDYWYELAIRFIFVIIFEHVMLAITAILSYSIPDVPRSIKEKLNYERVQLVKQNMGDSTDM